MARQKTGFRDTYRRMLPYLRRYRRQAVLTIVLGAVAALGGQANLALVKPLVKRLFPDVPAAATGEATVLESFDLWVDERLAGVQLFGLSPDGSAVVAVASALLLSALVFSLIQYAFLRLSRMLGVWMIADLRQDLARHVLRLGMRYHSGRRLGDLLSRLTADVGTSLRLLTLIVEELIQEPFKILGALTMAFFAAPAATLGMLLFLPILALPVLVLGPKVRKRSQKSLAKLGDTTQAMTQMFSGIRVVKAFRMEERETEEFRRVNQEFVHQTERMVKAQATSLSVTNFLAQGGIGVAIGLIALANHMMDGGLFTDTSSLMVFFLATGFLFTGVKRLTKAVSIIYTSMGATERVFEVLDLEPEIPEKGEDRPFAGLEGEIRFEAVGFDYGTGDGPAVQDISFRVKRGERVALVGSSGAGKSTLMDLVARFYDPTEGRILVDGVDLRELKVADWLDRMAMVGQQPFLFQTSLRENVRYGRPEASPEEVEQACRAANLDDFVASLPQGLDTQAGEAGTRLSGGQAQRVTIARAILRDADVLLLDEATSALDSESERRVQAALEVLIAGRTTFAIAHRLSTIRSADRILVLDQGRIAEDGSHDQLVAQGGIYAKMWQLQAEGGGAD